MKKILIILILYLFSVISAFAIERRAPQFLTESSYLVFPLPYSLPGIGQGMMITTLAGNINDTYIDAYLIGITGDAEGAVIAVEDIHLVSNLLILDLMHQNISKAVVNNYENRGMDTSKDDFTMIEVDKVLTNYAKLTLSFLNRRLELYGTLQQQKARITKIRNSQGTIIADLQEPFISDSKSKRLGFLVDYTDDRLNPKKGIRLNSEYISFNPQSESDPDSYTIDKSLSLYLPISDSITWAFNIYLSDAYVTKKGETDPDLIKSELGLGCSPIDTECLKTEENLVNMFINMRTNGTATSLGGEKRLRSYPSDRYNGAHSFYYATEVRWSLSEKIRPFNFGIWKDVATGLQVAFFYETGSVSEKFNELGDTTRSSYGVGFRLVSASGFVYRSDYADGDEGSELTVMFSYPW